ncbi:MAG: lysylphosphatidylglycerol synthase transmembrane domain-containing protein [Acidobacteriota bacterium]|nr:lysylphosphatidylglycerol synthase transmembrane domain-containing protein [Acidobacteriota bacterium]
MPHAHDSRNMAARHPRKASTGASAHPASQGDDSAQARKGALFLGAVVIAYIVFLVATGQMATFLEALSRVDTSWIAGAAICYALYFLFGVVAYGIAVYLDHDSPVGVRDLMSVEASGVFFGNLTPMMAGAVPSQIYRLTRTGLDVGEASATQFTRFIVFQLAVVLFAALMLAAKLRFFFEAYGNIVVLNLVVFGVHLVQCVGLFVICLCPGVVMRFGNWAIELLSRRSWLKDRERWDEMVNVQVLEFSGAFKRAAQDLPSMGLTLLVTMAQLASLYMIPWFVLNAFGKQGDFLECLAAGSMVQMVASAVPLPGGTGGAEGGFVMFYRHMFGPATSAGFLVWRIVTFFAPTIIAAPLLGLSTRNRTTSIYHRVRRIRRRLGAMVGNLPLKPRGASSRSISLSGKAAKRKASHHSRR